MRFFSTSLPFLVLLLGLTAFVSSCGDDDGGPALPTEAELTIDGGWGVFSVSNNLFGNEAEIAAMFTDEELVDEGYTLEEIIPELQFVAAVFTAPIDTCVTNNKLTFVSGGNLEYDYSDDCMGENELFIFDEEAAPYTWSLNDRQLTINSVDGVIEYTITNLTSNILELSIAGDRALSTFGEFETVRDFGVTFTVTLTAQ